MSGAATEVDVGGRRLRLTNLDKVLYPSTGTTKAEVIDYYVRIAPVMLPHLAGRALTLRRWPNGVEQQAFYEKNCPKHAPEWIRRVDAPGDVRSCVIDEVAALAWVGNQAALEVHVPMARADALDQPTMVVLDLDPGPPADLLTCVEVATRVRSVLESVGLQAWPKTSGSKGLQLYVPVRPPVTHELAARFALALGQLLERQHPDLVLTDMERAKRPGKVFVDWSQNAMHKTTIGVYSLRGRERPTVSTPLTWDEMSRATTIDDLTFSPSEVIDRVDRHGDLFEPVLSTDQVLPPTSADRPG